MCNGGGSKSEELNQNVVKRKRRLNG